MSTSNPRSTTEQEIVEATRRMIAAAVLYSHQVAEQLKLGPSDAQFMTLLDVHGPLTPGNLAELTGLKTGTVTGVLDRLENADFIHRTRDPHDRRKVIVTPNAAQIAARVTPHYEPQAARMLSALSRYTDDELTLIATFLTSMTPPS